MRSPIRTTRTSTSAPRSSSCRPRRRASRSCAASASAPAKAAATATCATPTAKWGLKPFDLMCRRAVSRQTRDGRLADLAVVQEQICDSWIALQSFRLLVLRTAWLIDKHKDYNLVRKDIAAIKVAMPKVYQDIAVTAAHIHGAMGVSNEMPFMGMVTSALVMGIADGPTEVHKITVAKQVLKDYKPDNDLFPSYHLPKLKEAALDKYGAAIEELKSEVAKGRAPVDA